MRIMALFILCSLFVYVPAAFCQDDVSEGIKAVKTHNYAGAYEIFLKEAVAGSSDALFNLGVMHQAGKGVPRDCDEAIKWFRMAAEHGNTNAEFAMKLIDYNQRRVESADNETCPKDAPLIFSLIWQSL